MPDLMASPQASPKIKPECDLVHRPLPDVPV